MDYLNDPDVQYWLSALAAHILLAFPLMKMAARAKEEPSWFAWVPVLNAVLALKVAKRPLWWLILFFVPFVNLVMAILLAMALCERFGTNKWWGLLGIATPFNVILVYYLAYGTKGLPEAPVVRTAGVPDAKPESQPRSQTVGQGASAAAEPPATQAAPARPEAKPERKDEDLSQPPR